MSIQEIEQNEKNAVLISKQLEGHLTEKEVSFLSVLPFLKTNGEILEIGSYKGKSTIIIARSALAAGHKRIFACDPLTLPSITDPKSTDLEVLPETFRKNLENFEVDNIVEFEQLQSSELSEKWNLPIKVLWIDGDHTYSGALNDLQAFHRFLQPGAIVALHDVLHKFEGPIKVFVEEILSSEKYGDCGLCGSIGWAQFVGDLSITDHQRRQKKILKRKLSRLIPHIIRLNNGLKSSNLPYNLYRTLVPHGKISPSNWIYERNKLTGQEHTSF